MEILGTMVEVGTIITIAIAVIIIGIIGFFIYKRKFRGGAFKAGSWTLPKNDP